MKTAGPPRGARHRSARREATPVNVAWRVLRGRLMDRHQALWASYAVETPQRCLYIGEPVHLDGRAQPFTRCWEGVE